jgi:integrase/recombinase XerD
VRNTVPGEGKALKVVRGDRPSPLAELVEEYLTSGVTWSRRTRDQYAYNLTRVLLPWAEAEGITAPRQLTATTLDQLHRHLAGQYRPTTVHSYLRSVNQLLNWGRERGEVGDQKAQLPKLKRRMLEVLSREELARMESAADSERDKLIIRLMADCGLRLNEVLGLRVSDLVKQDKRHTLLRVREAKGGDERLVPVPPQLWGRLKKYVEVGRASDVATTRVFTTRRRHADGTYSALEARTVQTMVASTAERANIGRRVHPHLLRHSYATWALDRGMNPVVLQGNMGHADLDMIAKVYSHLSAGQRWEATMSAMADD